MLTFVTWLWKPHPQYRSQFAAAHVNTLASMVRRHYPYEHRFVCVTDMPKGIDPVVDIIPAWNDHAEVSSPHGSVVKQPSCYRRLRAFHPGIAKHFGPRFVSLDLDTVITGDLSDLVHRDEEFVIWGETNPRSWYNGSLFMLTAGSRPRVWQEFNPRLSPYQAKRAGRFGSDQGWISYCLGKGEATWSTKDGVYSYRVHLKPRKSALPAGAKIVNFHGEHDPWDGDMQKVGWIREHYR